MRILFRLPPILIACLFIIVMIFGMVLFAYLFLFAAAIGIIFYFYNYVRLRFFASKKTPQRPAGRIIDSDDWHKL